MNLLDFFLLVLKEKETEKRRCLIGKILFHHNHRTINILYHLEVGWSYSNFQANCFQYVFFLRAEQA